MRRFFRISPWLMLLQGGVVLREHWSEISREDQDLLWQMMKRSKGRRNHLSDHDRAEIVRIAKQLRPITLARKVALGSRKRK
jgi:hypothetical protein